MDQQYTKLAKEGKEWAVTYGTPNATKIRKSTSEFRKSISEFGKSITVFAKSIVVFAKSIVVFAKSIREFDYRVCKIDLSCLQNRLSCLQNRLANSIIVFAKSTCVCKIDCRVCKIDYRLSNFKNRVLTAIEVSDFDTVSEWVCHFLLYLESALWSQGPETRLETPTLNAIHEGTDGVFWSLDNLLQLIKKLEPGKLWLCLMVN